MSAAIFTLLDILTNLTRSLQFLKTPFMIGQTAEYFVEPGIVHPLANYVKGACGVQIPQSFM